MENYWFFLSYARRDAIGQERLRVFYEELAREVGSKAGLNSNVKETEIGFFDQEGIETGDIWPEALSKALQTSRVFVCLFSPGYFNSEYCGREFQVFLSRIEAFAASQKVKAPPLIIPVLWDSPKRFPTPLPSTISEIQYTHSDFGETYSMEGLHFIMRLNKYKDDYELFKMRLAEKLVAEARAVSLPSLELVPALNEIRSAFHSRSPVEQPVAVSESAGPRFVQFIFVAARREEFRAARLRKKLEPYGDEGGMDWHPYLPDLPDEVALLAQEAALSEKLRYETVKLDSNIIEQLNEAERKNKIVAIIVDTWTLRLEHYHNFMREYDSRNFLNCIVLVPWNNKDDETATSRETLETAVKRTFLNRAISKDPNCFLDSISSPDELKQQLSTTLNKARMRIIERSMMIKKAESERVIAKPIVTGPGEIAF